MKVKVSYLMCYAVKVFLAFATRIGTDTWFTGIETQPLPEAQRGRKPKDGDTRSVTVFQGNPGGGRHQKVTVTFTFAEELGWQAQDLVFSGRPFDKEFSKEFFVGTKATDDEFVFAPKGPDYFGALRQVVCLSAEEQRNVLRES